MRALKCLLGIGALVLTSCSQGPRPSGAPAAPSSAGTATTAADAAARLTDACPLLPAELTAQLVPNAGAPERQRFPLQCTFRNRQSAVELTFDNGPPDAINGAEAIAGLGKGGYLERLDPSSRGDVYLTVVVGQDANGNNNNFHVTVAGHDGKDYKADAVTIARHVLELLK